MKRDRQPLTPVILVMLGIIGVAFVGSQQGAAQDSPPLRIMIPAPPVRLSNASVQTEDHPLPINLPTALSLAGVRSLDVALASQRIQLSLAQQDRSRFLWIPNVSLGADYFRHDGQLQDVAGTVFGTSKSTFMAGVGPTATFAVTDAIFGPLAARQDVRARNAALQSARNDSVLYVTEAYFNVQQARGELAGAEDTAKRAEDLVRKGEKLATAGLVPPVEVTRTNAEASRRRLNVHAARERWRVASADLARLLRLTPTDLVEPVEPPELLVMLFCLDVPVDELIPLALTNRPELESQQALVQLTLERLRQERLRPLIPSVLLRGTATNPAGTLAAGLFGGGRNDQLSNFSMRSDFDVQLLWELQNLGLGNRARVNERRAENELALLELFRVQDRIAAEVVQAHAQARSAKDRLQEAETTVKEAVDSAKKNLEGLTPKQDAGGRLVLLVRPQEVVAAIQALALAYPDYYAAVADYDRAQFRLYRALGHPAQGLLCSSVAPCVARPVIRDARPCP